MENQNFETKDVTKYKLYTLVIKVKGKNDRTDEVEHAIFTGQGALDLYRTAYTRNHEEVIDTYVREEWTELQPEPSNFSLPLNPTFKEEKKEEKSEDNEPTE